MPAIYGASRYVCIFKCIVFRGEGKGCDGGMRHKQEKEKQEESKCVGRREGRGGREGGMWMRSMEGNTESKEREMMGLIRIKTAGFLDNPELGPTCLCQLPSRLLCQAAAQIIRSGTCREPP